MTSKECEWQMPENLEAFALGQAPEFLVVAGGLEGDVISKKCYKVVENNF